MPAHVLSLQFGQFFMLASTRGTRMWILVGGVAIVIAITAATLLAIWAMSAAERASMYPEDDDDETQRQPG
jgi:Na+-transporting methylmalonyl-CoA/oxaloacetate decarboxylase gamma subunit